jgi:hypothetical protein
MTASWESVARRLARLVNGGRDNHNENVRELRKRVPRTSAMLQRFPGRWGTELKLPTTHCGENDMTALRPDVPLYRVAATRPWKPYSGLTESTTSKAP